MMRDYFLQNLGIGEVWKLRTPAPDTAAFLAEEASAPVSSVVASQSCDLVLICRHPEGADALLQKDAARLSAQLLAALHFNQTLNVHSMLVSGEEIAQVVSTVQSLRPRAVLVFGALDACKLLSLDSATVTSILRHGNYCFEDIPVIVTHELVTLLLQPALKRELWLDVCRVKDMFAH